ncbi:hypothetical protein A4A49_06040 [Nicotiana attenuata]|uniref:Uncharacterized protein n=1 Tax=Nicotiana attenuata TaxID=49451 RepID=A0A314KWJ7_NICAT|nr:hypothetical protein A4A49_06040 [Nicotiana attenuata]
MKEGIRSNPSPTPYIFSLYLSSSTFILLPELSGKASELEFSGEDFWAAEQSSDIDIFSGVTIITGGNSDGERVLDTDAASTSPPPRTTCAHGACKLRRDCGLLTVAPAASIVKNRFFEAHVRVLW